MVHRHHQGAEEHGQGPVAGLQAADKPGDKPQTIFDPKDPANKDSGLVWHFGGDAPDGYEGGNYLFGRTLSTCCVHDGLVYAAEFAGFLHCLDAKTGKEYWEHDLKAETWSSPYWVDGKIYIGDEHGNITVFKPARKKKILAVNNEPPRLQGGGHAGGGQRHAVLHDR